MALFPQWKDAFQSYKEPFSQQKVLHAQTIQEYVEHLLFSRTHGTFQSSRVLVDPFVNVERERVREDKPVVPPSRPGPNADTIPGSPA